jgi:hypothetical protein
MHEVEILGLP